LGALGVSVTALNIQHIVGNASDNFLTLANDVSGVAIDLGAGNDNLALAAGVNSLDNLFNIAHLNGSALPILAITPRPEISRRR
jgi:hypothetical protein